MKSKLIFPDDGITKNDLINYYQQISHYIIPFLKDRPLTIQRFPEGITKEGFFQQHARYLPKWFPTVKLAKKTGGTMKHILCQDTASLLYLVDKGAVVFHRWLSCIQKPNFSDLLVVDIDPPGNKFDLACKGARKIKKLFERKKLRSFVMTTGSTGLHVVIPIKPMLSFDDSRLFVKNTVQKIVEDSPDEFTLEIRKEKRGERVYFDILRNAYGHTAVAPFSVRALPGAPVAMPLPWSELEDHDLHAQKYTIKNVGKCLKDSPFPWKNFAEAMEQTIEKTIHELYPDA
jgi:bifunctional non-homologous end joining protein LigD